MKRLWDCLSSEADVQQSSEEAVMRVRLCPAGVGREYASAALGRRPLVAHQPHS